MTFSLAPGLLIAMPSLLDPHFHRAVVLLCAHSKDGAFGLILNHPLDLSMRAICADASIPWSGDDSERAFSGGPVERQRGWLLHPDHRQYEGSQTVTEGLAVTPSREGLSAYGREPDGAFRLLLGYAGWGPGQLDREVLEGAWLTAPPSPTLPFESPQRMWQIALASVGVNPTHLVEAPGHRH
jgi:putative transcriptional regulator